MARIQLDEIVVPVRRRPEDPEPAAPLEDYLLDSAAPAPEPSPERNLDDLMLGDDGHQYNTVVAEAAGIPQRDPYAAPPARPTYPTPKPLFPQGPDTELAAAQEQARAGRLWAGLARGINTAFGTPRADNALAQIQAQSDTPVQDLLTRRREEMRRAEADRQAQLRAERTDPQSETNRRLQGALQARLGDSIDPETLSHMTVEDTDSLGILGGVAAARDRAQQAREQRALQNDAREDQQAAQLQMAQYIQGEQNARNEADNAAAMERARLRRRGAGAGGGGAGADAQTSVEGLRQSYRDSFGDGITPAQEALIQQLGPQDLRQPSKSTTLQRLNTMVRPFDPNAVNTDIQRMQDDLVKSNAPATQRNIDDVLGQLDRLGDVEFRAAVGAPDWTPNLALPNNVIQFRTALSGMRNIVLKDRSGAAVTDAEFDRLKEELASGHFTTREAISGALQRLREIAARYQGDIEAGYSDSARRVYHQRRGDASPLQAAQPAAAPQAGGNVTVRINGVERTFPASALPEVRRRAQARRDRLEE